MPELPEVEVLVRHLAPLLKGKRIAGVRVRRPKVIQPATPAQFARLLKGARFREVTRRGKYLLFSLQSGEEKGLRLLVGHLGMTGRMYLQGRDASLAKHAAVVLDLGTAVFVYEDARYFGRLTLDVRALARLGPEPRGPDFTSGYFARALARSSQPIKVRLLDQSLVAGIGNIYAGEALFRARISPLTPARLLSRKEVSRLRGAIRQVLAHAIRFGSTVPLRWRAEERRDGLFYYGQAAGAPDFYEEKLRVYDRAGQPCVRCGESIVRLVQAGRSTYYCPRCQPPQRAE